MLDNLVMEARNTDITEILSFYGVEFYKNSCKCIFHDDNNRSGKFIKPSMSLQPNDTYTYIGNYCFMLSIYIRQIQ